MSSGPTLYPSQQAVIDRVLRQHSPRRAILAWDTGCGKTAGAIELIKRNNHRSTLIVCPAMVRTHWQREIHRWTGNSLSVGILTQSRRSIEGKGMFAALRKWDEAFDSNVLITSYELLDSVIGCATHGQFTCLIIDELHHIGNPRSEQSKKIAKIINGLECHVLHRNAEIYGLTATLTPTEIKQIWNPLRLFEGVAKWGKPVKNGDVSYAFKMRYCEVEKTDWGDTWYGFKENKRAELAERTRSVCFPLSREDVLPDMPPLDLGVVTGEPLDLLRDAKDVKKLLILTHTRWDVAIYHKAMTQLCGLENVYNPLCAMVTGDLPVKKRMEVLDGCANHPDTVRVAATYDSVLEGIRLLWPDEVLIFDWGASPGKLLQILGRFASVGSNRRPRARLVATDDAFGAAQSFTYRATAIADLGMSGQNLDELRDHVANMSEIEPDWDAMFDAHNASKADWSDDHASRD